MNKKHSLGFTLIELLVVISIISLLSSVVLAALKDARDRAQQTAFRTEVMQFINAIELYRADNNGNIPGPNNNNNYYRRGNVNGTIEVVTVGPSNNQSTYENALSPYLKKFPTPFMHGSYFLYQVASLKCEGDTLTPPYVVHITTNTPGFEDWPLLEGNATRRCFSF